FGVRWQWWRLNVVWAREQHRLSTRLLIPCRRQALWQVGIEVGEELDSRTRALPLECGMEFVQIGVAQYASQMAWNGMRRVCVVCSRSVHREGCERLSDPPAPRLPAQVRLDTLEIGRHSCFLHS